MSYSVWQLSHLLHIYFGPIAWCNDITMTMTCHCWLEGTEQELAMKQTHTQLLQCLYCVSASALQVFGKDAQSSTSCFKQLNPDLSLIELDLSCTRQTPTWSWYLRKNGPHWSFRLHSLTSWVSITSGNASNLNSAKASCILSFGGFCQYRTGRKCFLLSFMTSLLLNRWCSICRKQETLI